MVNTATFDLFLIRHGVTDWNEVGRVLGRTEIALNARGQEQAATVSEALRPFALQRVLASPRRRAQQTAEQVARVHGLSVQTEPGLDEVWAGEWEGKTWQELVGDPDLERYMRDPAYVCDALEPAAQVQERIVAVAEQVRATAPQQSVALVSHGDPIKLLLAHYLSMDLSAYRHLGVETGSVSVIRFDPFYGSRVLVLNWRPPGGLHELIASIR
jgi:broad specificity phosphatase PhoE